MKAIAGILIFVVLISALIGFKVYLVSSCRANNLSVGTCIAMIGR
jgi:hypothetical protein